MRSDFKLTKYKKNKNNFLNKIIVLLIIIFLIIFFGYKIVNKIKENRKPEPVTEIIPREEINVTILEGWRNNDIVNYFSDKWNKEDILAYIGERNIDNNKKEQELSINWEEDYSFLKDKPDNMSLEGYLFPDTYRIYASSSPAELVSRMLDNFDKKLTSEMRADIKKQGKTIHEIITMASIIEKEAPIFAQKDLKDAKIVSGIFWNRLEIGMALQSDATLSYILNDNKPAHSGSELNIDSPYNTYKYPGLIPGPICNPGIAAIEAAIYPTDTNYLYFLTTLDGKEIYYARTHDEHVRNKYLYLK